VKTEETVEGDTKKQSEREGEKDVIQEVRNEEGRKKKTEKKSSHGKQ
jgi:hypothetical protein